MKFNGKDIYHPSIMHLTFQLLLHVSYISMLHLIMLVMVDTMPIYVQQPSNGIVRSALWNGKYKDTLMKLELACDFLGGLISASSMVLSTFCNIFRTSYWKQI